MIVYSHKLSSMLLRLTPSSKSTVLERAGEKRPTARRFGSLQAAQRSIGAYGHLQQENLSCRSFHDLQMCDRSLESIFQIDTGEVGPISCPQELETLRDILQKLKDHIQTKIEMLYHEFLGQTSRIAPLQLQSTHHLHLAPSHARKERAIRSSLFWKHYVISA